MWNPIRNISNIFSRNSLLYRQTGSPDFITFVDEKEKIEYALHNPAFIKIAALQCDTFSLGKFKLFQNGEEIEKHPLLDVLQRPHFSINKTDFLWEWMFWLMMGKSIYRATSDNFNRLTLPSLIPLENYNLEFPTAYLDSNTKTILTRQSYERRQNMIIKYYYNTTSCQNIPLKELIIRNDLGIKGNQSRIEALIKIIQNNELSIDGQNINIKYAGKFMVSGKVNEKDIHNLPMGELEKEDIENKLLKKRPVTVTKSIIDIRKFVTDNMFLNLGESYLDTYFIIGNMYNIPRDVLEAYGSSTFENQEQARAAHVAYTLLPKAKLLCDSLLQHFNMQNDFNLELSYSHLPFMQVFEKERMNKKSIEIDNIVKLLNIGMSLDDINAYLGTNFKIS